MTKGSKTRNPQKPAMTIRDGALKATLWRREGESGPFYSVSFSRSYKKAEGEYADSTSFSGAELLRLAQLAGKAYEQAQALREQAAGPRQ